ncbi:hypothetical protein [Hoyosella subflava]|uniref:Uncharacterized protein n=1 Tax=Hoyosella subflava (strain DSM 45089 / JCM 17490 / NBRC 109087 / DQS3-9A1) TaxID=443218 RepID=F6EM54_HOYSD|nr:hypothetical protein [Hoyosella subflava]AEF39260.1 hypothetical protein AS9A_0808 [Hoyosella subflava DQS3-9A1]
MSLESLAEIGGSLETSSDLAFSISDIFGTASGVLEFVAFVNDLLSFFG